MLERLLRGYDYSGVSPNVDITEAMSNEGMLCRTTLTKQGDSWKLLEMSVDISMLDDLCEAFEGVKSGVDCICSPRS